MNLLLKFIKQLLRWCAKNIVYFMNLVQLVVPWEQREQGQNLKEYTSYAPVVHLVVIVAICEEAFRRSVPSCRYVFCEGWLGVDTSARTEICELDLVIFDQYVFPIHQD